MSGEERLQKLLARGGLGSRRGLEKNISAGQVQVNGKTAELGQRAQSGDRIEFDGKKYVVDSSAVDGRVIVYNKRAGEVTTRSDPEGRKTIFQSLPRLSGARWIAVGRLDIATTGLLLLTTDGELAHKLMHPSSAMDREYLCRVRGEVDNEMMQRFRDGVELSDGIARFSDIQPAREAMGDNAWFYVVLMEGRNREVRRMWESQGVTVSRLKRVRYGPVFLPKGLRVGMSHELSDKDIAVLREESGLAPRSSELTLRLEGRKGQRRR